MIDAVASATPSIAPTTATLTPSVVVRNSGSSAWMISDDRSMNRLTNPSTQTARGTAGGLGLDMEFFESVMVPQIMLNGFLGFAPRADGFKLNPRLPNDWPELAVDRIRFQNQALRIRVTRELIEITRTGVSPVPTTEPIFLQLPDGAWKATLLREDGGILRDVDLVKRESDGALRLNWGEAAAVRLRTTGVSRR